MCVTEANYIHDYWIIQFYSYCLMLLLSIMCAFNKIHMKYNKSNMWYKNIPHFQNVCLDTVRFIT